MDKLNFSLSDTTNSTVDMTVCTIQCKNLATLSIQRTFNWSIFHLAKFLAFYFLLMTYDQVSFQVLKKISQFSQSLLRKQAIFAKSSVLKFICEVFQEIFQKNFLSQI